MLLLEHLLIHIDLTVYMAFIHLHSRINTDHNNNNNKTKNKNKKRMLVKICFKYNLPYVHNTTKIKLKY